MFVVLFSFGDVMFVCCLYDVGEYGVSLMRVLGSFHVFKSIFDFLCEIFPKGFVVVGVGVPGLIEAEVCFGVISYLYGKVV